MYLGLRKKQLKKQCPSGTGLTNQNGEPRRYPDVEYSSKNKEVYERMAERGELSVSTCSLTRKISLESMAFYRFIQRRYGDED
jgi:hypothetical protein